MLNQPQTVKDFILAGNATITLESEKSGIHYTYKIKRTHEDVNRWFVSLLTGPDNEGDFTYLGVLEGEGGTAFRLTKKSSLLETSAPVAGFKYMWAWINSNRMPPKMHIHHEGRCGRCNRKLTVPESIESGIGPECRQHILHLAA